jgi:hypothetical protein
MSKPKLSDGMYKASLSGLRKAVETASTGVFVDKKDQERLSTRIMGEVEKKLTIIPDEEPKEFEDFIEVPLLNKTYKATIDSIAAVANHVRGYRMAKVDIRLFAQAWEKAHTTLDCKDLNWSGWGPVVNKMIDMMDDHNGDGTPTFIMLRAFDQWQNSLLAAGIPTMIPSEAPFHHFHVEVLAGESSAITQRLLENGLKSQVTHLHNLGARDERERVLLTLLSPVSAKTVHSLLKLPMITKVTASKLDYTS